MVKINIRKKQQFINTNPMPIGITVIYKSRGKNNQEYFSNDMLAKWKISERTTNKEAAINIYNHFNSTLRPKESKRTPIAFFHVYEAKEYVKIKDE
jgi:hypothetical protein